MNWPFLTSVIFDSATKYTAPLTKVYRISLQHFCSDLQSINTVVQDSVLESYAWKPFY